MREMTRAVLSKLDSQLSRGHADAAATSAWLVVGVFLAADFGEKLWGPQKLDEFSTFDSVTRRHET